MPFSLVFALFPLFCAANALPVIPHAIDGVSSLISDGQVSAFGPSTPAPTGTFLQVTDLHLDILYRVNSSIGSACHRPFDKERPFRQKDIVVGEYGAPLSGCDAPKALIDLAFTYIQDQFLNPGRPSEKPNFVLWTGDNARHDSDAKNPRTWENIQMLNTLVADKFKGIFGYTNESHHLHQQTPDFGLLGVPIVPVIGNNDISPHNSLAYTDLIGNPILDFYAEIWAPFIPADQIDLFRKGGFFVARDIVPGLDVVALNTIYLFKMNKATGIGECSDPSTGGALQMRWLETVLEAAQQRGSRVIVSGHVPPFSSYYLKSCLVEFTRLLESYRTWVDVGIFGHTHADSFLFTSEVLLKEDLSILRDRAEKLAKLQDTTPVHDPDRHPRHATKPITSLSRWPESFIEKHLANFRKVGNTTVLDQTQSSPTLILLAPSIVSEYAPSLRVYGYEDRDGVYSCVSNYTQYSIDLVKWYSEHGGSRKENGETKPQKPKFQVEYVSSTGYSDVKTTPEIIPEGDVVPLHGQQQEQQENVEQQEQPHSITRQFLLAASKIVEPSNPLIENPVNSCTLPSKTPSNFNQNPWLARFLKWMFVSTGAYSFPSCIQVVPVQDADRIRDMARLL